MPQPYRTSMFTENSPRHHQRHLQNLSYFSCRFAWPCRTSSRHTEPSSESLETRHQFAGSDFPLAIVNACDGTAASVSTTTNVATFQRGHSCLALTPSAHLQWTFGLTSKLCDTRLAYSKSLIIPPVCAAFVADYHSNTRAASPRAQYPVLPATHGPHPMGSAGTLRKPSEFWNPLPCVVPVRITCFCGEYGCMTKFH